MYPKPTPEQVQSYQENGFLVVENFLSPEQLANWQATTDEAVAQRLESLKPGAKAVEANATVDEIEANRLKANSGDDYYSQVFTQCIKLADSHAGMRKLIIDPSLGEFVSTLAGVDGMRVWHDQALLSSTVGSEAWNSRDLKSRPH